MAKINRYRLSPLLLVKVNNQGWAERTFHRMFDEKRTDKRQKGMGPRREWFKLTEVDLYTFIYWADIIGQECIFMDGDWELCPHDE